MIAMAVIAAVVDAELLYSRIDLWAFVRGRPCCVGAKDGEFPTICRKVALCITYASNGRRQLDRYRQGRCGPPSTRISVQDLLEVLPPKRLYCTSGRGTNLLDTGS